jgi:hypothetical protein
MRSCYSSQVLVDLVDGVCRIDAGEAHDCVTAVNSSSDTSSCCVIAHMDQGRLAVVACRCVKTFAEHAAPCHMLRLLGILTCPSAQAAFCGRTVTVTSMRRWGVGAVGHIISSVNDAPTSWARSKDKVVLCNRA